jgi:hypothetical protein
VPFFVVGRAVVDPVILVEVSSGSTADAGNEGARTCGEWDTTNDEDEEGEEDEDEFDVENTTILAVPPGGIVTTQNSAPPAPTAPPEHLFKPIVAGLHSHGRPLQPDPLHSTLTAKPGSIWLQFAD